MADPTQWGAVRAEDRREAAEQEELGRARDVSFLGEAARDPVAVGSEAALELVRSGEAGGLEIPRPAGSLSPYPMEPGESRAAQELPEMFVGSQQMTPLYEELQRQLDDPEAGFFSRMATQMQMGEMVRTGTASQSVGTGLGAGLSAVDKLQISAAAMTMFDPSEIAQMLTQVDPETGERKWPQFAIQTAPDGTVVVTNTESGGGPAIINRPGMSTMDMMQMLGILPLFTPAGKITAGMPSTMGRIAVGAGTMGVTEDIIQRWQEAAGGQYDPLDVAISAGLGPVAELGRPGVSLLQRSGRFIGSYVPENFLGVPGAWQGLKAVIPEVKAEVLSWARGAKEFLKSNRPAIITTQDAVPEVHAPWRLILLKMVERMPLTGTGRIRLAQREQRIEVLRNLASRHNLNPNKYFELCLVPAFERYLDQIL